MKLYLKLGAATVADTVETINTNLEAAMVRAQNEIALVSVGIVRKHMARKKAISSGKTADSLYSRAFPRSGRHFEVITTFQDLDGTDSAFYVEHGRDPGKPPPYFKILAWAQSRELDLDYTKKKSKKHGERTSRRVRAIMAKIAKKGLKGKKFMEASRKEVHAKAEIILAREIRKLNGRKNTKRK